MSPQTKSITSHASLFILFTHYYLVHPNYKRHCDYSQQLQFFLTHYSVTVPTCTTTVFQKLLQILSVETKKP